MNERNRSPFERPLIFGQSGQLGSALARELPDAMVLGTKEADFSQAESLQRVLEDKKPTLIWNAVAYTAVDQAETEPEQAMRINADSPRVIAQWCAQNQVPLIHYSTDYVFPGTGSRPWKEGEDTRPLNQYGISKRCGEKEIELSQCAHLIFRTSWVYDSSRKNFLTTILGAARQRKELRIVDDQIGAPTYALDLAKYSVQATRMAVERSVFPSGIFNMTNQGWASWKDFAAAGIELAKSKKQTFALEKIIGIPTREYPTPATRPLNSRLDSTKLEEVFQIRLPDWKDALRRCVDEMFVIPE